MREFESAFGASVANLVVSAKRRNKFEAVGKRKILVGYSVSVKRHKSFFSLVFVNGTVSVVYFFENVFAALFCPDFAQKRNKGIETFACALAFAIKNSVSFKRYISAVGKI